MVQDKKFKINPTFPENIGIGLDFAWKYSISPLKKVRPLSPLDVFDTFPCQINAKKKAW